MDEHNKSKALVVYVEKEENAKTRIVAIFQRIIKNIDELFSKYSKVFILLAVIDLVFFFLGNCISAYFGNKIFYIFDYFLNKNNITIYIIVFLFLYFSGYTVFGRITSILAMTFGSFLFGMFVYLSIFYFNIELFHLISCLFLVSLSIFLVFALCSKTYLFYSINSFSGALVLSKRSLYYFIESTIIFSILLLLSSYIINLFW